MADEVIGRGRVELIADLRQFKEKLKDWPGDVEKKTKEITVKLRKFSRKWGSIGRNMSKGISAPLAGIGVAATAAANEIDKAMKKIAIGTNASGTALEGLGVNLRNIYGAIPSDLDTIAGSLADLNTITGASGETLETLTTQILEASRMAGEEGAANAASFGRALVQWGIAAEDGAGKVDILFALSQDLGIGFGKLSEQLRVYGAVWQNAGFSMEESAVIMANMEKVGIDLSRVMPGLNAATRKWADAGLDVRETLGYVIDRIKNTKSETEALTMATNVFGAEGAQRLLVAIRQNALNLDDLSAALSNTEDRVKNTAAATMTFGERLTLLKNKATLALEPIGNVMLQALENLLPTITSIAAKIAWLSEKFSELSPRTQAIIVGIGALVAAIGPALVVLGSLTMTLAGILPLLPAIASGIVAMTGPVGVLVVALGSWALVAKQIIQNWELLKTGTIEIFSRIADTLGGFAGNVNDSLNSVLQAVNSYIDSFREVGANIVLGLWEGIQSKLEWLKGKVADATDLIPETMKKVLGIASASKVAQTIGKDTVVGLAKGIEDNEDKAADAARKAIGKINLELLEITHGRFEAERAAAREKAAELTELEGVTAQEIEKINLWLQGRLEEINQDELEDTKTKNQKAIQEAEKTAREINKKMREQIMGSGSFAAGWKLALSDMQNDTISFGEIGYETFESVTHGLGNLISDTVREWDFSLDSLASSFEDFAMNILNQVIDLGAQMAAQNIMGGLFGGGAGIPGVGGLLGGGDGIPGIGGAGAGGAGIAGSGVSLGTAAAVAVPVALAVGTGLAIGEATGAGVTGVEEENLAPLIDSILGLEASADQWGFAFTDMANPMESLKSELSEFAPLLDTLFDVMGPDGPIIEYMRAEAMRDIEKLPMGIDRVLREHNLEKRLADPENIANMVSVFIHAMESSGRGTVEAINALQALVTAPQFEGLADTGALLEQLSGQMESGFAMEAVQDLMSAIEQDGITQEEIGDFLLAQEVMNDLAAGNMEAFTKLDEQFARMPELVNAGMVSGMIESMPLLARTLAENQMSDSYATAG